MYYIVPQSGGALIYAYEPDHPYILVDELPSRPADKPGYNIQLDVDIETGWVAWEYVRIPTAQEQEMASIRFEASTGVGINAEWLAYIYELLVLGIDPIADTAPKMMARAATAEPVTEASFSPPAKGYGTLVQEGRRALADVPDEDREETKAFLRFRLENYPEYITDPDLIAEIQQ